MGILRKNRSVALLIAVTASAPFLLRCGSDSGTSGTGGGGSGDYGGNAGSTAGGTQPIAGSMGFPIAGSGGQAEGGTGGDEAVAGSPAADGGGEAGAPTGNGGAGGSSGSGDGGTGGAATNGNAGAAGSSAGMSGSGGASGAGGVNGASGSSGAGSGTPGHLSLSATALEFSALCPNPPTATPLTVTLTNTGGTALTWTATFDSSHIFDAPDVGVSPNTSTLAPGAHVDVTVSPAMLEDFQYVMGTTLALGDLSITTDVPADTAQIVMLSEDAYGYFVGPPDLTTFGTVTVGDAVQKTIRGIASPASPAGIVLQSSNSDFPLSGLVPSNDGSWTLTFQPSAAGPESTTLTASDMFGHCIYPPSTFVVTGTGAYGSCAGLQGIKCAVDATCQSGTCALIATITPLTINAQVGVPYTGFVGLINDFDEVTKPEFDVVIDYGDGHTSESIVNGDTDSIVSGDGHTYTQAGTFNGGMTITEIANGLSTSAVIPVIVTN